MVRKEGDFDSTAEALKDLHLQRSEAVKEISELARSLCEHRLPETPTEADLEEYKRDSKKRHHKMVAAAARYAHSETAALAGET